MENYIEDPLSESILRGEFKGKNQITVRVKDAHLFFDAEQTDDQEEEEKPVAAAQPEE